MSIDLILWQKSIKQFNDEQFFECHETLEVNWLYEQDLEQKQLLQGIIHIAAAFFHYRKNNIIGYRKQLEKGLIKLKYVRLDVYDKKLNTGLSDLYQNIQFIEKFSVFPKIHITASAASR